MKLKRLALAGLLTTMCLALVPAGAVAGSGVSFSFVIGWSCIDGYAPASGPFHVVWKGANGVVKAEATLSLTGASNWQICSGDRSIAIGDVIKATLGSNTRKLVVPKFTMTLDRVGDLISGRAPAGTDVHVTYPWTLDVPVDADGRWSLTAGVTGGMVVTVQLETGHGDQIKLSQFTPVLYLTMGETRFQVFGQPRSEATVTLSRSTAAGERIAAMPESFGPLGEIWDRFRDQDGRRMRVHAGDHISAPLIASDADWIVPDIEAGGHAGSNVVNGYCDDAGTSSGWYNAAVWDPDYRQMRASVWGWVNADGNFSIDFDDPASSPNVEKDTGPGDVISGDVIDLWCMQVSGDAVIAHFIVP